MTIKEFYSNYSKIMVLKANKYFTKIPILNSYILMKSIFLKVIPF